MKVNQNIKIRPNYKTLAMVALFGLVGCKEYEFKNVITQIETVDGVKVLEINDVETDVKRIYKIPQGDYCEKWLVVGDTVTLCLGGVLYDGAEYYQKHLVLTGSDAVLKYNFDSLFARQERQKFKDMKQQIRNDKQK